MTIRRQSQTIYASAARTTAQTGQLLTAEEVRNSVFVFDCTVDPSTASVTPSILGVDPVNGNTYTILTGAAVAGVSTIELRVGPDFTAAANVAANTMLPLKYRFDVAVADAESLTYSVSVTHMVEN